MAGQQQSGAQGSPVGKLKQHGISLNTYLPFDEIWLKDEFEGFAKEDRRSVSEMVVTAMREYAERRKKNPPQRR